MTIVKKFKQYPLVLWALALYLCSLGFNLKYDIPLAIFAIFAMVSMFTISNADYQFTFSQMLKRHWPVLVFLIVTAIVTLASRDVKHSVLVQVQLLPALLIYLCLVLSVDTDKQRLFIIVTLVLAALVAELSFMAQVLYLSEIPDRLEKMWAIKSPLFIAPNDVLFFSVLAPLAACLVISEGRWARVLGVAYLLLTLIVTVYMQSRQAVGVYLGSLCLMALLWRPAIGAMVIIGGAFLVLVVDWFTGKGLLSKLVYLFPRRYVWEAAWQMFLDRPWFGHGPGMFKEFYVEYVEKAGYVFADVEDRRPMRWAHSLYLEQLAERGLAGFFALMFMMASGIAASTRLLKEKGLYGQGLLACWVAYGVAGIAETSLLRIWTVSTLFILSGLACQQIKKHKNPS